MSKRTRHLELKNALLLFGSNISAFARSLTKPDGVKGISHTAVIRVAQGHDQIDWIDREIEKVLRKARREFPEYYNKRDAAAM